MSHPVSRPVSLLIAALGGEGGGVLTNWVVKAAQSQGYPVQATSIPGVAQRTGATTYYIEIWPQSLEPGKRPVLALSPAPGDVDIVATSEMLEAGRCIQNGFVTPQRTHLLASTHRVYTTFEKMAVGDGRFDMETLFQAAKTRSQSHFLADLEKLASENGSRINAVLLGALAASGRLPLTEVACREAIRDGGKAVEANLRGFEAGLHAVETGESSSRIEDADWLITEAEKRLTEYQDRRYSDLFQERLASIENDDMTLRVEVIKNLARWMSYEDIIRVAQLKIRTQRLPQIEDTKNGDDIVHVTEYFRPGIREVCDILPAGLSKRIMDWAESNPRRLLKSWPLSLRSTTILGYLSLRLLAALRPLRRKSYRFQLEQEAIDHWLSDIRNAYQRDPLLALEIARNARLIKGYGSTHARGKRYYESIRLQFVDPALKGQAVAVDSIAEARDRVQADRPG